MLIAHAPRNLGEQSVIHSGHGAKLLCHRARLPVFGSVHFDLHDIGAAARVFALLIDSERETSGDGRNFIAVLANQKRLRHVFVAKAPDQSAASRIVEGQNAKEVPESASKPTGPIVLSSVGIAQLAGSRDDHVFAGLYIDACVHPGGLAGKLHFLREPLLTGRRLRLRAVRLWLGLRRRGSFANKLGVPRTRQSGDGE